MKKYIFSLAALAMLMGAIQVKAQNFDDDFVDKTLRVDYTFAGNSNKQLIAVDELNVLPRWYTAIRSLPFFRNGSPIQRPRPIHRVSRMSSWYQCQKIQLTSL